MSRSYWHLRKLISACQPRLHDHWSRALLLVPWIRGRSCFVCDHVLFHICKRRRGSWCGGFWSSNTNVYVWKLERFEPIRKEFQRLHDQGHWHLRHKDAWRELLTSSEKSMHRSWLCLLAGICWGVNLLTTWWRALMAVRRVQRRYSAHRTQSLRRSLIWGLF